MNHLLRIALLATLASAGPWGCNNAPLEVPPTPAGVSLDEARMLFDEFCPDAALLAEDADPSRIDALYIYDVAGQPLRLGEQSMVLVSVTNLGDARNTADWGVEVRAGGETATRWLRDIEFDAADRALAPCEHRMIAVPVPVGPRANDGSTVSVQVSLIDADGVGHQINVDRPVDGQQLYERLCPDGPSETDVEHSDLSALAVIDISGPQMGTLIAVDVVNLSDRHFGADWGVRAAGGQLLQSEIRMRQDRVGIAPCARERLLVSVDGAAQLVGTGVEASVIDGQGNPGHTVNLILD